MFLGAQIGIFDSYSCEYKILEKFAADMSASSVNDQISVIHFNIVSLHKILTLL